jgi:hypothetical protein
MAISFWWSHPAKPKAGKGGAPPLENDTMVIQRLLPQPGDFAETRDKGGAVACPVRKGRSRCLSRPESSLPPRKPTFAHVTVLP